MRAWGTGPFENSAAMDWLGGLASGLRLADLAGALGEVDGAEERAIARAAATLVMAALGEPGEELPETARRWLEKQDLSIAKELRTPALKVAELLGNAESRGC